MFELIPAAELKTKLSSGTNIIIVDARRADAYEAGHIPGAINLLWEQWCEDAPASASAILHQPGWWGRLEDVSSSELGERLANVGLSNDQQIVVYADGVKSKGRDGRIAWMLLYFGAKNVSILDGGWDLWLNHGGESATGMALDSAKESDSDSDSKVAVATKTRQSEEFSFEVNFDFARRTQLKDLVSSENGRGVDTRTVEEHAGYIYVYQPRLGRIPNSINIPFSTMYKSDGRFLNREEFLKALPSSELGGRDKLTSLDYSYCEVGVRAATFSLLYELFTGKKLPVFDGSFMEWAYHQHLPIERD
jgi:thiosulfate/3-mercaptopyruvate sulfurtransferase